MRPLGASLALAGASVAGWGALAVTQVGAGPSLAIPDCGSPDGTGVVGAPCLHESQENVSAAEFGAPSCDSVGITDRTHDWFVFNSRDGGFTPGTFHAYFLHNGVVIDVTTAVFSGPHGGTKFAVVAAPNVGDKVQEATSNTTDDKFGDFFNITHTCAALAQPTPTPTAYPTPTPTAYPTPTPTAYPTPTPTAYPTPTPKPEETPTPSPAATPTPRATPTPKPTATPDARPSPTPDATPTPRPTATPDAPPSPTPHATPTADVAAATSGPTGGVGGITAPNTGVNAEAPIGIGIGLMVLGLSLMGASLRRRSGTA